MLLGEQRPRVEVVPSAYDSAGPEVADLAADSGVILDPWQRHVLEVGLAEDRYGKWSALQTGLVVPRQNGKTAVLAALCLGVVFLNLDGIDAAGTPPTIIFSAHEFKTAKETFRLAARMVRNGPLRSKFLKTRESGVETGIEFRTGARILFVARSGGSGRGFSGDLVVFDEAFALRQTMLGALLPTLSARPNPQVWLASSPSSPSSAAPRANPALGYRLTERFIAEERRTLDTREFERERLGIGDEPDGATAFDVARWQGLADADSKVLRPLAMAWDITPERDAAAIAVSGVRADGRAHVEVVEHIPGTDWLLARLVELWGRWKVPFWCEAASPAASLVGPLEAKGVEVKTHPRGGGADALFADAIQNGSVRHLGQASLTSALVGSRWRISGDTRSYSRGSSATDICPLKAGALAHYGAMVEPALVPISAGVY